MNRRDFQALSSIRLREARALFKAGLYDGAYYLAGYAVECALKACIAKMTLRHDFPDRKRVEKSHSHEPLQLIVAAQLTDDWRQEVRRNLPFRKNWELVQLWTEQSRYERHSHGAAEALLNAVWNPADGVIAWLKQHW